jgi:hypothetical protein
MFERYTGELRHALLFAQAVAVHSGRSSIEVEDMFAGLLQAVPGTVWGKLLPGLAPDDMLARMGVARFNGEVGCSFVVPLSHAARRVLVETAAFADGLRHHWIRAEHMLTILRGQRHSIIGPLCDEARAHGGTIAVNALRRPPEEREPFIPWPEGEMLFGRASDLPSSGDAASLFQNGERRSRKSGIPLGRRINLMSGALEVRLAAVHERNVSLIIAILAPSVDVSIEAVMPTFAPQMLAERLRMFPLGVRFRSRGGDIVLLRFDPQESDSARVEIQFQPFANSGDPERNAATFCATSDRVALSRFIHELQIMHASGDCARLELTA